MPTSKEDNSIDALNERLYKVTAKILTSAGVAYRGDRENGIIWIETAEGKRYSVACHFAECPF